MLVFDLLFLKCFQLYLLHDPGFLFQLFVNPSQSPHWVVFKPIWVNSICCRCCTTRLCFFHLEKKSVGWPTAASSNPTAASSNNNNNKNGCNNKGKKGSKMAFGWPDADGRWYALLQASFTFNAAGV